MAISGVVLMFAFCGVAHASPEAAATKIAVTSMTVNGLKVKNLSCTLKSGGFFAAAKVVGALAKQGKALKACAKKKKARPRVSWTFKGKGTAAVAVTAAKKPLAKCIKGAMKKVRSSGIDGTCAATLIL